MNRKRLLSLLTLLTLTLSPVWADLTVELVNDTGLADSDVYVLLRANNNANNSVTGLTVADGTDTVSSVALSTLTKASGTIVSPYSGDTLPIYQYTVASLDSGVMNFSFGTAIQSTPTTPAPSPATTTFRFDQMEYTFIPGQDSVANLTTIDSFGIPIQLELFDSTPVTGDPIDARYMYTSTPTLIDLFQTEGLSDAIYALVSGDLNSPWQTGQEFIRILGPQQVVQQSSDQSPAPYSDFSAYLHWLVNANSGNNATFSVIGTADGFDYNYSATLTGDGNGNYNIALTGTTTDLNGDPVSNLGSITYTPSGGGAPVTVDVPANAALNVLLPEDDLNFNIYGVPLNSTSYSVAGLPSAAIDQNSNTTYSAIVRDVISAINFGYLGSVDGDDTQDWFSMVVPKPPFGAARATNDGYYNPWAALIYNNSDAYGFAFSDRSLPSPAVSLEDNYTMRLTILPDTRMDAPAVTVSDIMENSGSSPVTYSATLSWDSISNATGYVVQQIVPELLTGIPVAAADGTVSYTLDDLEQGIPYAFQVSALGEIGNNDVRSAYRTVTINPPDQQPADTSGTYTYQVTFNASDPADEIDYVMIDDIKLTLQSNQWLTSNGTPARPTSDAGETDFVVQVFNSDGIVYAGQASFSLTADVGDSSKYTISGTSFPMYDNEQSVIVTNPNQSPFAAGVPAVIAVTYVPVGTKLSSPVVVLNATEAGPAEFLGGDFFDSPFLGTFFENDDGSDDFLYAFDFGWVFITQGNTEGGIWFWQHNLQSWYWGSPSTERFIFSHMDNAWLYVFSVEGGAFVYNVSTDMWTFVDGAPRR
ncbi:hypothetical protein [Rubellicoccus peritrichatus]|uniref:Fibronectin type-III domain-containing protein n=1 Tax=Rubellicoccus peritrichatus TaxID=3080537 RepID=A0AAQ3QSS5_9BACT|nr:hypothetical protein [Puniceicoccus sp. CR14]WOO40591.1 hypothetical protein RZN69_18370 [Puniceicoccus sp. CR14]